MIVVGIDPSLTGTGIAVLGTPTPFITSVASKGKAGDDVYARQRRLRTLADRVTAFIPEGAHVAIETPAHNQTSGHHHDRSGLWWMLAEFFIEHDLHFTLTEVSTTQVKKYATGKGTASKMEVMAQMIRRHPDLEINNDNEADAVALATLLSRALGQPLEESLPKPNLTVLENFRPTVGQSGNAFRGGVAL